MTFEFLVVLLAGVTAVSALARRTGVPAPFVLVVAGLVAGYLPGVPRVELDPDIVLVLILPPLLYAAALSTAFADFGDNLGHIGSLSVGLVLATTAACGLAVHLVLPSLPIAAAFALGAIVAPPDAIAATAVARRLGLPRQVLTILEGESLLNDATALVTYRIAVTAALSGAATWSGALVDFAVAAVGGAAIGLALGVGIAALRRRLEDPRVENSLSLLTPFAAFLPAEHVHASGVLSVVVAGLYLGRRSPVLLSSTTRLQAQALWSVVTFLLEGFVFALIGLQLPAVIDSVRAADGIGTRTVVLVAVVVTATVVLVRPLWIFAATYLPRLVRPAARPAGSWRSPALVSWAGMRGVVSLAAAFGLPVDMPGRDLILLVTFVVIIATLLVQGPTLPWLVRRLDLDDAGAEERQDREVAIADHHLARTALLELARVTERQVVAPAVAAELQHHLEERVRRAHALLGGCPGEDEYDDGARNDGGDALAEAGSAAQLRRDLLRTERAELQRLYRERDVDDEVHRRVLQQLDVEELALPG